MYYERHIEQVIARIAKRKPVIVMTGARQVGKTTVLKKHYAGLEYVTMTDPLVWEASLRSPSAFFSVNKPPLIVDEIQRAGALLDYVKLFADETESAGLFFLTGSQSFTLMKNVSDSLAGRAGIIKLLGLSLREINRIKERAPFVPTLGFLNKMNKLVPSFDYGTMVERIHKGSFPELYKTPTDVNDWRDFYSSYFQTYIERDIRDLLKVQDEAALIRFVRAVAALSGEMLNYRTLAEACGKDVKTCKSWLSVLESSGLVYLLEPYYNNALKRMVKTPKLYFLDTGFGCWLSGWNTPEQLVNGARWGHVFETYVIGEVLKSYSHDGIINPPLFYYRDSDKQEIDLVIEDAGTLYPVEIKTTSDPVESMAKQFRLLYGLPGKQIGSGAVVCMAKNLLPLNDNVWITPANCL
ncbi:MAG: ATP-binding protein [Coriobacteriaceae bacterium]|jgi:predicted AAA+ superfamily ATPase|nr:ATP-binding protein [Coriobacteriaceae bacterium]